MPLDYLIHPVIEYALLALGLGASAYLFVTLKNEMRTVEGRLRRRQEKFEAALFELGTQLERARAELKNAEEEIALSAFPSGPLAGMNFTKRSQALRMLRRRESPEHVAAALQLAHGEVDLLCKVHSILAQNQGQLTA